MMRNAKGEHGSESIHRPKSYPLHPLPGDDGTGDGHTKHKGMDSHEFADEARERALKTPFVKPFEDASFKKKPK